MKTFSRYLFYRLKSSALRTLVFTIVSILLTQSVIKENNSHQPNYYYNGVAYESYESCLYIIAFALSAFATLLPMLELSCFKNRRNLDTLYFLPIKREKLALAHYVSGAIQLFVIYTFTYILAFTYLARHTSGLELSYMLPYYFLSMLLGLLMYSVFMFIFAEANNVTDGALFCFLWMVAPFFLLGVLTSYAENSGWGCIFTPINALTTFYARKIEMRTIYNNIAQQIHFFLIWGGVGIASIVGYFISFVRKGAEKAGEISDSWFGYKTLIPICGFSLLRSMEGYSIFSIFILILMVAGYVIYRRGFKFKASDIAMIAGGIILSII